MVALLVHGTGVHVDLPSGSRLTVIDSRLLGLRPLIARSIGLDDTRAVDDALAAIASREPLLVLGPRGLDEEAWLGELSDDVLRVDLEHERFTAPQASALFAVGCDRRVVFRALTMRRVRVALDSYADRVRVVRLVPLSARRGDVVRILDAFMRELGEARGAAVLSAETLDAIARYRWTRNLDELREYAPRLLAMAKHGTLGKAARALGIARQTLSAHLERIGAA